MIQDNPLRILICTGHTGGHFFPAASFAEAFSEEHPEVKIHILTNRMTPFAQTYGSKFHLHVVSCSAPPSFFSFKLISFLLEYVRAFWRTVLLFRKLKPRLVAGFGSYSSIPGVVCGVLFKVPILLHEQNAVPGRANRLLAFLANRIATSFPDTQANFPSKKVFWTGYPLRSSFLENVRAHQPQKDIQNSFTILILGGSQGAKRLNEVFLEVFCSLRSEERTCFAVIHITGSTDFEWVKRVYDELKAKARVFDFSHHMSQLYQEADLVISRAGAGTIFEVAAAGKPAILVPYPHAYGHQRQNAIYLAEKQAAWVIEEQDLSCEVLREAVLTLYRDSKRRHLLGANIGGFTNREAGRVLVENTWSLMCEKS